MPVVSRYCNICNRLITSREIESGEAIVYQTYYYCPKCKNEAMPIIEAIRRRQEREAEKEKAQEEEKGKKKVARKSSTRFGPPPKIKPSSKPHKYRKSRSGIFENHRTHQETAHKVHIKQKPRKEAENTTRQKTHKPVEPPKVSPDEVEPKEAITQKPDDILTSEQDSSGNNDSERIMIIDEIADDTSQKEGMSYEEVVSAAEHDKAGSGTEDQLAASGITFEDVAPGEDAFEPEIIEEIQKPLPAKEDLRAENAVITPQVAEIIPDPKDMAKPVILEAVEPGPEAVEIDAGKIEISAPHQSKETKKPAIKLHETKEPAVVKSAHPKFPSRVGKTTRHIHPGKRHTSLRVPEKKKPWLFIVIIILVALIGSGLIVYKQFFLEPPKNPSEVKKEEDQKKRYEQLEKDIDLLVERSRKIAENPADFEDFTKKARELRTIAMPDELRKKLTKAQDNALERFESVAKVTFSKSKADYEKALSEGKLQDALDSLLKFPGFFKDTAFADEMLKLKRPLEATIAVLENFNEKKPRAAELEREGRFDEAASLIEEVTFEPADVLTDYLDKISIESERLRDLAKKERERREKEAKRVLEAFKMAQKESSESAALSQFQTAIERLVRYRREFPDSAHENEVMRIIEDLLDKKRRAEIRNFFNGKDFQGWSMKGSWNISESTIVATTQDEKAWLLKGDLAWSDYTFEFDFKRVKGSLALCARAEANNPESGFTLPLKERPFQADTWYHAKCDALGDKIYVTTSFNNQKVVFTSKRSTGLAGFLLFPNSEVHIKNVTMELP